MRIPILLSLLPLAWSFVLEGSDTSYARFSRWNVNTTLSFEFNTNQPDGLIVYTDDGGKSDFFELKLVEGILRLRFNLLNQGTQLINIGQHLNDGLWHRVELSVSVWNVLVTVDGFVSQGRNMLSEKLQIRFDNTGVFIGGLPGYFNSRLGELTLPSVVFEPRFRGAVRNLVFGAQSHDHVQNTKIVVKPQEIVESKGLISGSATSEACERHDPCLHGGFCISTDSGPVCDCKHIDFEGVNCELEKSPTTATFHGSEYIGYDFRESGGQQPIISQLDEISLYFKTSTRTSCCSTRCCSTLGRGGLHRAKYKERPADAQY
ncbi:Neurexin-2 [Orchesella cincta]|uniref:Neurexin-2 n=1 Tax=Orchesella cincta TaxID=48709 RepID=A0A1D2MM48_ORCCI|nr:Neurexin-2 [Orchesella cincta]